MPKELTKQIVMNWVAMATGPFQLFDIAREMGVITEQGKSNLRVIMHRLAKEGVVERVKNKDGMFRPIDNLVTEMEWQSADPSNTVKLKLPLDIHEYALIYPKSVIIVAGEKNAGKTAFLLNIVHGNMGRFIVDLFNTETGKEQFKQRMSSWPDIPSPAPFRVFERYDNFADVIHPDHISVIDYMDFNSELYNVGEEIDRCWRKTNSVVVIGLQKPPPAVIYVKGQKKVISRDLAYGGAFTAKRAVLYISLSFNRCKLVYVKNPSNPKVNPNNMQFSFQLDENGTIFKSYQRYFEEGENGEADF